jgi:hypothetical protein
MMLSTLKLEIFFLFTACSIVANVSTTPESNTVIFTDDTAVLATKSDPAIASQKLQTNLAAIQNWLKN